MTASTINAGRVELDLVAIARDQVSATLREANKSLAATKAQMDSLRPSTEEETAALERQNAALERLGQTSGLYQTNAQKLAQLGTQRIAHLQGELAAMEQMGAAEGPLAQAHQAEIAALQQKTAALQQSTIATASATSGMAQAETAGLGLAGGLSKVWSGARLLVNILPGLGMAGLVGGVIEGFSALFDLIAGNDNVIPDFVGQVKQAASAEYEFTKQVSQMADVASRATSNVNELRVATLKLGAANAEAAGDEKRAAELMRQAGITAIRGDIETSQASLDELSKIQDDALKKRSEAEAKSKHLAEISGRAQFEYLQAVDAGNEKAQGYAIASLAEASVARQLADNDAKEAERVFNETSTKIAARNESIRAQREQLTQAENKGIGDITLDPMLVGPGSDGGGGGGGGGDPVAEWKAKMADLSGTGVVPNEDAAQRRLLRRLDRAAGGQGAAADAQAAALAAHDKEVKQLVSDYQAWSAAIGSLVGPLGALDGTLGKVAGTMQKALGSAAAFAAGDWLGGITGVLGGIVSLFSDTAKKARGIARDAERDLSAARGGPSTIIINVAPGSDPQAVARATRQVMYSTRGTGNDSRVPGV